MKYYSISIVYITSVNGNGACDRLSGARKVMYRQSSTMSRPKGLMVSIARCFHKLGKLSSESGYTSRHVPTSSIGGNGVMTAWTVQSKRNSAKLDLTNVKTPHIRKPSEVIVKVLATSVNPIDIAMLDGYGNTVLDTIRQIDGTYDEFRPKILGRDFCGEIISKGNSVRSELSIGDIIYGVVTPHLQGCHAEQVVVDENMVCLKPNHLDINKAAGILYTALTAWSALKISGDLYLMPAKHKRILVVGASGGVGSAAVQLLKAWGAEVIATCRTDAMYLVGCLNPDMVIDYTNRDALHEIKSAGKYDIILDASGNINPATYIPFLKDWSNSKFITLRSPFLKNTDSYGLIVGMVRNVAEFVLSNAASGAPIKGSTIRWAFFAPIPAAVEEISGLVAANKVTLKIKAFTYNVVLSILFYFIKMRVVKTGRNVHSIYYS